jgi:hypothetical protein
MYYLYNFRHRRVCHQSVSERWWMHRPGQRLHVYMCGWLHWRSVWDRYDITNNTEKCVLISAWQGLCRKHSFIFVHGRSLYLNIPLIYLLIYSCISHLISDLDECVSSLLRGNTISQSVHIQYQFTTNANYRRLRVSDCECLYDHTYSIIGICRLYKSSFDVQLLPIYSVM